MAENSGLTRAIWKASPMAAELKFFYLCCRQFRCSDYRLLNLASQFPQFRLLNPGTISGATRDLLPTISL